MYRPSIISLWSYFVTTAIIVAVAWAADEYQFICENKGTGLSIISVLNATGNHGEFIRIMGTYDPDGLEILSDVLLADKTVWIPTNAAFAEVNATLSSMSDAAIKKVLGYHISPPRRSPTGEYDILTPKILLDAKKMKHRTRTGVLTGSDQRTKSTVVDGKLRIEGITIGNTAWCTQSGSVFSIDKVIMDVALPSGILWTLYKLERILFYDDARFIIWPVILGVTVGSILSCVYSRVKKKLKRNSERVDVATAGGPNIELALEDEGEEK